MPTGSLMLLYMITGQRDCSSSIWSSPFSFEDYCMHVYFKGAQGISYILAKSADRICQCKAMYERNSVALRCITLPLLHFLQLTSYLGNKWIGQFILKGDFDETSTFSLHADEEHSIVS